MAFFRINCPGEAVFMLRRGILIFPFNPPDSAQFRQTPCFIMKKQKKDGEICQFSKR